METVTSNVVPFKRRQKTLIGGCNCGCKVFRVNSTHENSIFLVCSECSLVCAEFDTPVSLTLVEL